MRLLLLSNSTNSGQPFLSHASDEIRDFLGTEVRSMLFVPFAAVRLSYDAYAAKVQERFQQLGYAVQSIHQEGDPARAVAEAEALMIGGGNTFHLVKNLYEADVMAAIRERVQAGIPYLGWSAGANVACPTLKTTNDMPIVEPPRFQTLGLVPFQINPHYTDVHPEGHQGETRDERLAEFVEANPGVFVVGLREGSMLRIESGIVRLLGGHAVRVFVRGQDPVEYGPEASLQFLISSV